MHRTEPPAFPVVAVGASAGGVEALWALLAKLPAALRAPVLVVMHLAPHAASRLPAVLARHSALPTRQAEDGAALQAGQVYVARPDQHLMLEGAILRLTRGPKESRARPAVDVLFRSVAYSCGPRAIGVVLSGMLDDGTAGLWAIKDRGGVALVQEPAEAAYDGMPLSAMEHVDLDLVAPASELAVRIAQEVERLGRLPPAPPEQDVEARVAAGEHGLEQRIMELGPQSPYTCPQCHGVLTQIEEGRILRFRCHTGHAYSAQALLSEVEESVGDSLWNTIRALEEELMLVEQLAARAAPAGHARAGTQVARLRRRLEDLRGMVASEE